MLYSVSFCESNPIKLFEQKIFSYFYANEFVSATCWYLQKPEEGTRSLELEFLWG